MLFTYAKTIEGTLKGVLKKTLVISSFNFSKIFFSIKHELKIFFFFV
jgi:hypothetical protein